MCWPPNRVLFLTGCLAFVARLKDAYQEDKAGCVDLLISGHVYCVDFAACQQYRKDMPSRTRQIVRRRPGQPDPITVKGVAGVYYPAPISQ